MTNNPIPSKQITKTFGLHVLASPGTLGAQSALTFAQTALAAGHQLKLIFFNGRGVLNATPNDANISQTKVSASPSLHSDWIALADQAKSPLSICTGSATSYQVIVETLPGPWQAASLGDLLTAYSHLDRVITFKD